jgi:hypothetical protein
MDISLSTHPQDRLTAALESPRSILLQAMNTPRGVGLANNFFSKLRTVLSISAIQDIVSWLPEGKIWRIHKVGAFKTSVMPLFSEVSQWEEFVVLLKLYGFNEVSRGLDSIAFYNQVRVSFMHAVAINSY